MPKIAAATNNQQYYSPGAAARPRSLPSLLSFPLARGQSLKWKQQT